MRRDSNRLTSGKSPLSPSGVGRGTLPRFDKFPGKVLLFFLLVGFWSVVVFGFISSGRMSKNLFRNSPFSLLYPSSSLFFLENLKLTRLDLYLFFYHVYGQLPPLTFPTLLVTFKVSDLKGKNRTVKRMDSKIRSPKNLEVRY